MARDDEVLFAPEVLRAVVLRAAVDLRGVAFRGVDFRQASRGPVPVSTSNMRPIGTIHLLKNGAATVNRSPVTASLSVGNIVANRMKNAEKSRIQLLARNAASRDAHESSSCRDLSSGSR